MALKKWVLLLFSVQISDSFRITNCSDYKLVKSDDKTIEIGCTASDWYGYCTLQHLKSQKKCTYAIWNKLQEGYRGHNETDCKEFPNKIQFRGIPDRFYCKFEIANENITEDDSWMITMEDWKKKNLVSSEKFTLKLPKEETGCLDRDAKFVGSDLVRSEIKPEDVEKNSWKDCQILCSITENCSFWSWESNRSCFLKNNDAIKNFVYCNTTISGSKDCENCHKLEATLNETKARSLGLNSCSDISYQAEMLHFERTGSAVGAFVGSMVFAAAFYGSIFLYYYIVIVRSEGPVTMNMLKNGVNEIVEIQTEDEIHHEPYEEIILEVEEPYEEIVSEDEVKEPGASPKTLDPSYFFQYYLPHESDDATEKWDSSYNFEYYEPGQDEEERKSLKSQGSEYIIHRMSDNSE